MELECKYCDHKIIYNPCANFSLFCPKCKASVFLECEYGYGPVIPCKILVGAKHFATVQKIHNEYILEFEESKKKIILSKKELDAIHEADKIVSDILNPNRKEVEPLKIVKKSGSLSFYGEWFGRPYDNFHKIKDYSYTGEVLEIVFDNWERLIIIDPNGIVNTEHEFCIEKASSVKWTYYPYGLTEKSRKIVYSIEDNHVYKTSMKEKEVFELKEVLFAVMLV